MMDKYSSLISSLAVGFEDSLSKQKDMLDSRIGTARVENTPATSRDAVAEKLKTQSWNSLTNQERNAYLYG